MLTISAIIILLDSPGVKYRGGSGIPFDWSLLANLADPQEKIILAGGLNPGNVDRSISKLFDLKLLTCQAE